MRKIMMVGLCSALSLSLVYGCSDAGNKAAKPAQSHTTQAAQPTQPVETQAVQTAPKPQGYTLEETWFEQPVDHSKPDGETYREQVLYLRPDGLDLDNIKYIFFGLGNEIDSDAHRLAWLWKSYGAPQDMLFILAEHRGYGQSQTKGDQTVQSYVTVKSALKDYDLLINTLKPKYPGALWVGAGYSYGGALTINFAHDYPQDLDMIIASSPPVRWPFYMDDYNDLIYSNLGKTFTDKMAQHMANLKPVKTHDQNWYDRELIGSTLVLMTQTTSFRKIEPQISAFIDLPTPEFMAKLKPMLPAEMTEMIDARELETLTYEQAHTGKYNWYTWKWQQSYETGTAPFGAPFPHTKQEIIDDYKASFKMDPPALSKPKWDLADMIPDIKIPFIMVNGGADPWMRLGVPPENPYTNVDYVFNPTGEHVPDLWYKDTGLEVGRLMREHLAKLEAAKKD